jgi:hypothetical protein
MEAKLADRSVVDPVDPVLLVGAVKAVLFFIT